jgi:hypothetical protein
VYGSKQQGRGDDTIVQLQSLVYPVARPVRPAVSITLPSPRVRIGRWRGRTDRELASNGVSTLRIYSKARRGRGN